MLGALLSSLALSAAPVLDPAHATLEQVLATADDAHVDIALARLQLESAEQDARGAYAYILPRVDMQANITGKVAQYCQSIHPQDQWSVYHPSSDAATFCDNSEFIA